MPRNVIFLLAALALAPALARAQSDDELAKRYYKLGEELYNRGDYRGALAQFEQAFKYSQKPEMHHNIGRCHEALGQLEQAIRSYEEFLKSGPPNAVQIQARIDNLRARSKEQQVQETRQQRQQERQVEELKRKAETERKAREQVEQQDARRKGTLGLAGWISLGGGGALLITGTVLGVLAKKRASTMEDANRSSKEYADYRDTEKEGERFNAAAIATWVIGGVAAATGIALVTLHYVRRSKGTERAWIAPGLLADGALVAGGVSF